MKKTIVLLMCVFTLMMGACKQTQQDKSGDTALTENVITENVGKYPRDIQLFQQEEIASRLKELTGGAYDTIMKYFQTQTPVVTVDGVYKITGCKEHNCPSFHTTILYDAPHDNLNVVLSKNGKVKVYAEKGKITVNKVLQVK